MIFGTLVIFKAEYDIQNLSEVFIHSTQKWIFAQSAISPKVICAGVPNQTTTETFLLYVLHLVFYRLRIVIADPLVSFVSVGSNSACAVLNFRPAIFQVQAYLKSSQWLLCKINFKLIADSFGIAEMIRKFEMQKSNRIPKYDFQLCKLLKKIKIYLVVSKSAIESRQWTLYPCTLDGSSQSILCRIL